MDEASCAAFLPSRAALSFGLFARPRLSLGLPQRRFLAQSGRIGAQGLHPPQLFGDGEPDAASRARDECDLAAQIEE